MYIDDEELRGLYKTSATEHIQAIESALMQLEKQPQNSDVLKELLRSAHTLKGDSRMLGVEDVETLVHQIEECLMPIDKGQGTMTEQLCERLYLGLDTIKKLAHTAVSGELNDVNMFYVLATLMGDVAADAIPSISALPTTATLPDRAAKTLGFEDSSLDMDAIVSDDWVNAGDDSSVFDTPRDLWVHERPALPLPTEAMEMPPGTPPEPSQLKTSFLELAADLFPAEDSTLPPLDRQTVLNDFTILPGTSQSEDLPSQTPADYLLFAPDDNFTLIPSTNEIGDRQLDLEERALSDTGFPLFDPLSVDLPTARYDSSTEDDALFSAFDNLLMPLEEEIPAEEFSTLADRPEPQPPVEAKIAPPSVTAPKVPTAPATNLGDERIDTIRVDAKQLDALMGQSGEINVINQQIATRLLDLDTLLELWENGSRDYQHLQNFIQQNPSQLSLYQQLSHLDRQWAQMGALISKFKKSIGADSSRLELVTSAIDSGVQKLRLLPLSTILNLFPRMVRDLAKTQSKEINFAIEGGDLLLDKRLLEEIKDPLMHILRNAIDHGIETPLERQQNGKLAAATLIIQVRQTGNQTTIEILDDGRGLDLQRIKATAIKRGLHTKEELDAMSVDRIQSLIFASGFSTRARVTELSGRGVGLDIVKTNIERIKGSVDVESSPDRGCTFRIVLSHAIGSSQVMMVEVRHHTYAIPVEYVDRMLLVNKAEIFALSGTPTTQINGQTTTVAWLADLLDLPALAPDSPGELTRTSKSIACLLLQSGRQKLALLVDRIEDRQLVTIESPHPLLHNVPHLAGATILGTGEVCLVLNPLDLFATAGGNRPIGSTTTAATTPMFATQAPAILLVEDSLVIRTQMTRILQGAGYRVTVANDGLDGWEKLQAEQFDLVVSDVEMPRWGGLKLTTEIRNHADYQHLPIVLVTTLSQSVDRDRGFEAGATAYLTKGDFDQQLLLDTLNRLI
ncbi:hybrid sensor histidine kinase/response regulator [Chamaesiphon minutus]|uniref:histidine kinase n=1 Tax=Chamaesiphon minutus (strain ATCC 27169 / PCC 6605) TaxID=1173020 RepID=K9UL11_CHAP6|nr:hybrid sensor histidine kinase/response regulator [Chamaesiphon minutus]AFY95338.1 chemotaxis protein histidine kinase-like protein [Chamaesiphon minutus PCC 6605]